MFRVGQKVVCVKTHSQGAVIQGRTYEIQGLRSCPGCKRILVDVGILPTSPEHTCSCGHVTLTLGIWWLSATLFAPLEEISDTTFDEIMQPYTVTKEN